MHDINVTDFPLQIEEIVRTKRIGYIEAVEVWCDENEKDIVVGAEMVKKSPIIREKIKAEAESLNLLPKSSKLPI